MDKRRHSSWKSRAKVFFGAAFANRQHFLKNLFFLNLLTLAVWAFWGIRFSLFSRMGALLHANPDSATYSAVCDWIYGQGPATMHTLHRTFLYPLLMGINFIAGNFGIWLLQFILLLSAINIFALAIHELSSHRLVVQAAFLAVALYPTFFFMTFRIMTETLTVFLLSIWLYGAASALKKNMLTDSAAFLLMFIAGLLSVTKPVFLPFFILLCLAMLVAKTSLKRFLLIILAGLPIIFQAGINVHLHDQIVFSNKGESSVRSSFLPQLLVQVRYNESHPGEGGFPEFTHAQKKSLSLEILSWPAEKRRAFFFRHWTQAMKLFLTNIFRENMTQGFGEIPQRFVYFGTKIFNISALALHFYMFPVILFIFFWKIGPPADRIWLLAHVLLFILLALSTGTVYWQGERYVFILMPLWITIYVRVFYLLKTKIKMVR
jgi:hypothetical protein